MNLIKKFKKWYVATSTTLLLLAANNNVFASGIGTAEVQTATENIKRVITSIAMPLRWSFNFCKYCSRSIKNDYKCKQSSKKVRKYWKFSLDMWSVE